ncbi:alpha/beta hydrolase [Persephonella atlantica]|uniref:Alpha/beta hydrolase n=1 Tax=Persephonella atlantica TaxID=2699429 RepID=A0ABS1GHD9_9AQUI|nr:alpha/beta hydrolase [Persephonella atlantica]MBK3332344.1 alpha/beta hydrolase [Persephonella atlantica]
MKTITLIIHGWSDCSQSFVHMKEFLIKNGIGDVDTIYYADYESREDNITYDDVIDGLYDRFKEKGFIDEDGNPLVSLNVIVHSTGGLIIRHFISEYYSDRIDKCPIKKIVMLAPANFGSPLAHYGKSLLGMVFKGRYKFGDMFEVGRKLLSGLELASPFQWELAHRDIFSKTVFYSPEKVQTFIFVGADGYSGLRKIVNKKGTDGTVVVSGADLKTVKFSVDFTGKQKKIEFLTPHLDTVFCVLRGYNHGSIVEEVKTGKRSKIGRLLLEALRIKTPQEYTQFKEKAKKITEETFKNRKIYQQFFIRAVDDHKNPVKDYTIEFFVRRYRKEYIKGNTVSTEKIDLDEIFWSEKFHTLLTDEFHTNTTDSSYRRFLVDIKALKKLIKECCNALKSDIMLSVKIHVPRVDEGIYYNTEILKNILLLKTENGEIVYQKPSIFYPNTTTMMELKINRSTKYVTVDTKPKFR